MLLRSSDAIFCSFMSVVRFAKNSVKYHAERIQSSVKGLGTDEKALIRIIITRSEVG